MSSIKPLIKREFLEFKKHFFSIILFWIIFPVFIHTFLAIPLSRLIMLDIRYLNWSAPGIWITTSVMVALLESSSRMRKIKYGSRQIDAIIKAPVSNMHLVLVNTLRGFIYGFGQLIFAVIIISALNNEYLNILSIIKIFFHMLFLIIHFSIIGTLLGMLISNGTVFINILLMLFISIIFGFGNFIPIKFYPQSFSMAINNIPITYAFDNIRSIIVHYPPNWLSFFLTLIGTIFLFIISLILSHKIFRIF